MTKFEKGKAIDLTAMIDYADGGVVSKELIHNPGGSITLFSFDAGQGLSEHTAPFDAMIQVLDGAMELTVEGKLHNLTAGQALVIPMGASHSVNAAQRFKMLITMIKG